MREYSAQPIAEESLHRVLEAGRATGSSQNKQPWKFYVVSDRSRLDRLTGAVFAPSNLTGCRIAIAVVATGKGGFDGGRATQNMILAAWNEGIGSCPNGVKDLDLARDMLGIGEGETLLTILSLGYPLRPYTPKSDDVEGILTRIKRKPLDELVVWV